MRYSARILFVAIVSDGVGPAMALPAQAPRRTSDAIVISGVGGPERRRPDDAVTIGAQQGHPLAGRLILARRDTAATDPTQVAVWARGADGVMFVPWSAIPECLTLAKGLGGNAGPLQSLVRPLGDGAHCPSRADSVRDWAALRTVISKAAASPVLRARLPPGSATLDIVYLTTIPAASAVDWRGEIVVAAAGYEPFTYPISLSVTPPPSSRIAALMPFLTTTFGALLGAALTYAGFRAQQSHLREREQERAFFTARVSKSQELAKLFTDYAAGVAGRTSIDKQGASDLRDLLISGGAYGMMPPDDVLELERVCSADYAGDRLAALNALVTKRFGMYLPAT